MQIEERRKFQFLIGTIKTQDWGSVFLLPKQVSIPYRYYKNKNKWAYLTEGLDGFNSL